MYGGGGSQDQCLDFAVGCLKWARLVSLQLDLLQSGTRVIHMSEEDVKAFAASHPEFYQVCVLVFVGLSCLNHYHYLPQPVSTCLYLPQPVSTCLNLSLPASTCLYLPQPASTCLNLPLPASTCLYLPQPVSTCLNLSQPVSTCFYLPHPALTCLYLPQPVSTCLFHVLFKICFLY